MRILLAEVAWPAAFDPAARAADRRPMSVPCPTLPLNAFTTLRAVGHREPEDLRGCQDSRSCHQKMTAGADHVSQAPATSPLASTAIQHRPRIPPERERLHAGL